MTHRRRGGVLQAEGRAYAKAYNRGKLGVFREGGLLLFGWKGNRMGHVWLIGFSVIEFSYSPEERSKMSFLFFIGRE